MSVTMKRLHDEPDSVTVETEIHSKCGKLTDPSHGNVTVSQPHLLKKTGKSCNPRQHLNGCMDCTCINPTPLVKPTTEAESDSIWNESTYELPKGYPEANQEAPEDFKVFDDIILSFMKEQRIPGASLCIGHKGKIVHQQTYGWATANTPVRPTNRFRIASITKALTATGIMSLIERGCLKLQDKVFGPKGILNNFSPGPKGDRRVLRITVKHLLQHSAGWDREEVGDPVFWRHVGKEMDVPEPVPQNILIQYMMNQKLQFSPGTKHVYSNFGYCVLGRIIEKVTGDSYENFIQALLHSVDIKTIKLGRTQKHFTEPDEVEYFAGPRCNFVDSIYAGEGRVPAPYGGFAMETGDADGGWIATAEDLVRFFQALDGTGPKRILSVKSFKAMTDRPSYMKGSSSWYGFGLDVSWNRKAWEHSGTLDGATSSLVRDNNGYVYAMLCNYWPEDSDYTSVVSYAIKHVPQWSKTKIATVPQTDTATLDKCYAISIRLPLQEFPAKKSAMASLGYSASWIVASQFKGKTFFSVIWTNTQTDLKVLHALTEKELSDNIQSGKIELEHIDSYLVDDCVYYSIIYWESGEDNVKNWNLKPSLPLPDADNEISYQKDNGFVVTCLSIVSVKSDMKATILFRRQNTTNANFWVKTGLNSASYQSDFNKHARYSHMMTYVKPYYNSQDQLYFSTVWTNSGSFQYTSEFNMSKYRLLNDFLFVAEKGYKPLCLCGYEEEDAEKFVAVCVKEVPPHSV